MSPKKIVWFRELCLVSGFVAVSMVTMLITLWGIVQGHKAQTLPESGEASGRTEKTSNAPRSEFAALLNVGRLAHRYIYDYEEIVALRQTFIRWNGLLKFKLLKTPTSDEVIIGDHNWLFINNDGSLQDFRRLSSVSPHRVFTAYRYFKTTKRELKAKGIRFLYVIAPNKATIYPEFMPDQLDPLPGPTQLDQFVKKSMNNGKLPSWLLDLRPNLLKAKQTRQVYYRDDTHWNDYGAFVAYTAIAKRLKQRFPDVEPMQMNELKARKLLRVRADLPLKMGIPQSVAENVIRLEPAASNFFSKRIVKKLSVPQFREKIMSTNPQGEIDRALIVGDSFFFATSCLPFLSQHFKKAYWYRVKDEFELPEGIIEKFKPNVVIMQRVERLALSVPPNDASE